MMRKLLNQSHLSTIPKVITQPPPAQDPSGHLARSLL